MQVHHAVQTLRLWVLAWFVLALGAATASPLIQPQAFEIVCSGGSAQLVIHTAHDGLVPMGATGLDCPLCLAADAPPAAATAPPIFTAPADRAHAAAPGPTVFANARTHPPARAPPFFLQLSPS